MTSRLRYRMGDPTLAGIAIFAALALTSLYLLHLLVDLLAKTYAFFFLQSPQDRALAVAALLFGYIAMVVWAKRSSRRRPVSQRVRPPREEPVDLAAARHDFEASRDSYLEEKLLGKAG